MMKNLCRLCAKEKTSRQLIYSIDDSHLDIEQKLIACCRWDSFIANDQMPKMICTVCWKSLEQCYTFAEHVALAQQQLFAQFIDTKVKVGLHDPFKGPVEPTDTSIVKIEPIESDTSNELHKLKNQNTNNKTGLENDEQSNHNQESTVFLCEICGKGNFTSKSNLSTHTKMHLPMEKRKHFECYICRTTFSYKKSILHHMSIHSGRKIQFQCKNCMANFSRSDALRRHSLIHLNKFTHCCPTCGKRFRTKFNLKTHERTHTGERPYACMYCAYCSGSSPNLGKHIRQKHKDKVINKQFKLPLSRKN